MKNAQNIQLAVFDIDGTLLGHLKNEIEPSSVEAIHAIKAKGIKVLVASGRSIQFVKPHVRSVLDSDYYVTINGHCVRDRHEAIVIRHDLNPQDVQGILDLCGQLGIAMGIKTANDITVLNDFPTFYEHYAKGFDAKHLVKDDTVSRDSFLSEPALGIFLIGNVDRILPYMDRFPNLRTSKAGKMAMDVFDANVDKVRGIQEVLNLTGLTWENVMAFGDGDNDLEMLKAAYIGVAMGNATPIVKDNADFTTLAVDEGGIAYALKAYGLLP